MRSAVPAEHLSSERRLRHGRRRPAVRALLALFSALLEPLQRLVNTHREEFDHGILHAQAAFKLADRLRTRCELHQHVVSFAVFGDAIREPPLSPFVYLVHRAARVGDILGHLFDKMVDLFFCRIGFYDEQILVDSHRSSSVKLWARPLKRVMDISTPSAITDSAASAPRSMNASR